jgi:hypothetical protein
MLVTYEQSIMIFNINNLKQKKHITLSNNFYYDLNLRDLQK